MPENAGPEAWATLLDSVERLLPGRPSAPVRCSRSKGASRACSARSRARSSCSTASPVAAPAGRLRPVQLRVAGAAPARERVARELLGRFEPVFVVAHVKDVGPDGAEVSTPEVGTGVFVQEPYFEFLQTRRPDLPLILEHLDESRIPAAMELVGRA